MVTANVSDGAGNPATRAQHALLVDKFADTTPSTTLVVDDTADHLVNAAEAGAVGFTVAGLDTDATAVATFTDGTRTRSLTVTANGSGSVDPTGFHGSVASDLAITDLHANTASVTGATIVLDMVAPASPTLALANDTGASSSDRIISDPTLASTPSAPGDTLLYALDGGVLSSAAPTIMTDGQHTVSVVEQDTAGNVSATASLTFTLDTSVPVAPVIPVVPVNPPLLSRRSR